jgi:translocon-associated protein subunit alpha
LKNKGDKDFVVETMDAAFRYPQDYSFYIQNFTTYQYHQTVEPKMDATFEYSFVPSDSFSSRPFGLTINLNYRDADGNMYQDAVFNTTITISDPEEGFDGETFFLYVFLAAVIALIGVGLHQLFNTYGKRRLVSRSRPTVELGTQSNKSDVDYDWLPQTLLNDINKSPKAKVSPKAKTPPRQRKVKNHD